MVNNENITFFEHGTHIKEETWGGAENKVSSIAFKVPEGIDPKEIEYNYVLKEPRGINYFDALAEKFPPQNEAEKQAVQKLSEYFDSKERFLNSAKDYKFMKEIFGDLLPETQYIIGEPRKDNEQGYYILQQKINGKTWSEFSKGKPSQENQEFLMLHRNQLMDLIGGARKVLIESGATVDIWGDNLMVDENDKFVLIDTGSPSELERQFTDLLELPKDMRSRLADTLLRRVTDLNKYPASIEMTDQEIKLMNEKFSFTQEQYEQASNQLLSRCETLSS